MSLRTFNNHDICTRLSKISFKMSSHLVCDSCAGQNKNFILLCLSQYLILYSQRYEWRNTIRSCYNSRHPWNHHSTGKLQHWAQCQCEHLPKQKSRPHSFKPIADGPRPFAHKANAEVEPVPGWRQVSAPVLRRHKLFFSIKSFTSFPWIFVSLQPHKRLWALR